MPPHPFNRGLSPKLLRELADGHLAPLIETCRRRALDVRLRDDSVNLYHRGRSIARVVGRATTTPRVEVHRQYLADAQFADFGGWAAGEYRTFAADAAFVGDFVRGLDALIARAESFAGHEELVEADLLTANADGPNVWCFDRQVQVPGNRERLDVMGLRGDVPTLVAVEIKRYPDPRIQHVPAQLAGYLDVFDPGARGLRADVATSYQRVCAQLRALGLPAPDPGLIEPGMPVEGLIVLTHYNDDSALLARALEQAQALPRPVYLWQPTGPGMQIPPAARWRLLGAP